MIVAQPLQARRARRCSAAAGLALSRRCASPRWLGPGDAARPRPSRTAEYRYSVALPAGCRHDEGPGTLDAICSAEFDPEKSATASAASALVLEVAARPSPTMPARPGRARAALRRGAVQGGAARSDLRGVRPRPRQDRQRQAGSEGDASRRTRPTSPAPRSSSWGWASGAPSVQFLITPGLRYRLMARAPKEDFEQRKEADRRVLREFPRPSLREGRIVMNACVVVFPGSNCDRDVKVALEAVTGRPVRHGLARRRQRARPAT